VKKPLKTSSKTAVKKTSTPAKVKTTAKAKPAAAAKKLSKPAPAKPAKKTVTKAAVKAKPVEKKAAPKSAAKPAAKAAAQPVKKAAPKTSPKPVTKAKAVAKPVGKPAAKPVAKTAAKVAVKTAPKAAAKPSPKTPLKAPAKPAAPVKAEKAAKPAKAEKPAKPVKADKASLVVAPVVWPVVTGDVPARAVRPSARLAQITVPSMAQSVASTAAKASYLQNMPTQALTPPPFVAVKKDAKLANNWKTKKPDQLSDAEVMAMSDKDYMNDAQMAFFRIKLVVLKQGILANAGETTEHLREDTVVVPDPADRATIEEEHALELRTRDRERKLLKKIEQSIQRIDSGDYGYCDETGEPIGVGRLLARPTANLSLEAQQRRELKQKMFGD